MKTKQQAGGLARAQKLTPEQRKTIASDAAQRRYLRTLYCGNLQESLGVDVDCYVLNDDNRTAVISQRGIASALGLLGGGGYAFKRFSGGKIIRSYLAPEVLAKIDNPIKFQSTLTGPGVTIFGYDVTILIDVCRAITSAGDDGKLTKQQQHLLRAAAIINGACAKLGIQELVYKTVGMDSTKEQFLIAFRRFVRDEARRYESEFPIELYREWTRLYDIQIPERGWPWKFRTLTIDHVYTPLAKSNGRILKLLRTQKSENGDSNKKLFQFLSDIGTKALRFQLGRVLEMAESSKNRTEYENKVIERFGGQLSLDLQNGN